MTAADARRDRTDAAARRARQATASIVLLVVGITLETIGIALAAIGPLRWVLVGAGVLLLLVAVLRLTRRGEASPAHRGDPSR